MIWRFAGVARAQISAWSGYSPTPLVELDDIAAACGVGKVEGALLLALCIVRSGRAQSGLKSLSPAFLRQIYAKDEGSRFGVGSFKSLGAPFAVCEILREVASAALGREVLTEEIIRGDHKHVTETVTVATASDGNHGVAVAWAAKTFGCRSIIYMHGGVTEGRADFIRGLGAVVCRFEGSYDDSVRRCAADAAVSGWPLVQDVSWQGYEQVPRWIYQVPNPNLTPRLAPHHPTPGTRPPVPRRPYP